MLSHILIVDKLVSFDDLQVNLEKGLLVVGLFELPTRNSVDMLSNIIAIAKTLDLFQDPHSYERGLLAKLFLLFSCDPFFLQFVERVAFRMLLYVEAPTLSCALHHTI